ncbi:MAG: hypothetical protein AAGA96_18375 [Verrucomicrobiota bacterium]
MTTLTDFRDQTLFESWEGEIEASQLAATRLLFRQLIDDLIGAGEHASSANITQKFERCVKGLNKLDEEKQFICTIEREELCDELYAIGAATGMPDDDWVDEWRDW